jgi:hypothetical protein
MLASPVLRVRDTSHAALKPYCPARHCTPDVRDDREKI